MNNLLVQQSQERAFVNKEWWKIKAAGLWGRAEKDSQKCKQGGQQFLALFHDSFKNMDAFTKWIELTKPSVVRCFVLFWSFSSLLEECLRVILTWWTELLDLCCFSTEKMLVFSMSKRGIWCYFEKLSNCPKSHPKYFVRKSRSWTLGITCF